MTLLDAVLGRLFLQITCLMHSRSLSFHGTLPYPSSHVMYMQIYGASRRSLMPMQPSSALSMLQSAMAANKGEGWEA